MKLEVYKITNRINGKQYIGITNQGVETRFKDHIKDSRNGSVFPIHRAIRKYGLDKFQIDVIEDLSDKDYDYLKEREIYWVEKCGTYKKGYNCTLGGDGTFGRFHSEETKDKIRKKAIGREISEETKRKMSDSHKKRKFNHSELSARAIKANKKRWTNLEYRENFSKNNIKNKTILQYSLDMVLLQEFRSLSEAGRSIGKGHQNISHCARGKLKSAYGFIWKYKENNN